MKISDELIACYVEGTITAEERNFVRKYLCEHPEEYERVLCLMDNDTVDYLGEYLEISENCIPMNEIAFYAAAFMPMSTIAKSHTKNISCVDKPNSQLAEHNSGLYDRLNKLYEEIDF